MTVHSIAHADHSIEARYLAAIFMRPQALEECPVAINDLASPAHQSILGCFLAIRARGEDISPMAVHIELERQGRRGLQERAAELSSTLEMDPTACARRIRELAEQRRIHAAAMAAAAFASDGDVASAKAAMAEVALESDADDDPILSFREIMLAAVSAAMESSVGNRFIKLGIESVDASFSAGPGDLVIIGAATGMGKSTFITTSAVSMARRGAPVGIISIEDNEEDFGAKGLGAISGVPTERLWNGAVTGRDFELWNRAIDRDGDLPIRFAKIRSRAVEGVISRMARMVRVHGCRAIFVDYLQAIRHRNIGKDTREKVNDTLAMLMAAAAQLEVSLVLCSQLRRGDGTKFHEPSDRDLKESGDIENSAQCIVLLWRETDNPHDSRFGVVYGKVAKVKRAAIGRRFWMRMENGVFVEGRGSPPSKVGGGRERWEVNP